MGGEYKTNSQNLGASKLMILQPRQILSTNSRKTHLCGLNALVVSYRGCCVRPEEPADRCQIPIVFFSHIAEWKPDRRTFTWLQTIAAMLTEPLQQVDERSAECERIL